MEGCGLGSLLCLGSGLLGELINISRWWHVLLSIFMTASRLICILPGVSWCQRCISGCFSPSLCAHILYTVEFHIKLFSLNHVCDLSDDILVKKILIPTVQSSSGLDMTAGWQVVLMSCDSATISHSFSWLTTTRKYVLKTIAVIGCWLYIKHSLTEKFGAT